MKKFCLSAILAAVLMLPCAQAASAAEDTMGVYVAPRVTLNVQHFRGNVYGDQGLAYTHSTHDVSVGGGLAVGYDFSRNLDMPFRMELEYAAYGSVSDNFHDDGHTSAIELEESLQTVLFNVYWDLHDLTFYQITPYVTAGAGVGILKSEYSWNNSVENYGGGASDTKAVFAGQIGLGFSYAINDTFAVDLGYRFLMMGEGFARGSLSDASQSIRANLNTDRNFAHMVSFGLRATF